MDPNIFLFYQGLSYPILVDNDGLQHCLLLHILYHLIFHLLLVMVGGVVLSQLVISCVYIVYVRLQN